MSNKSANIHLPQFRKVSHNEHESECHNIKTHTKQKPSKISNITFTILPFYQKEYKLNDHPRDVVYFVQNHLLWNLLILMKTSNMLQDDLF